mgnify:CR=1 FL=1
MYTHQLIVGDKIDNQLVTQITDKSCYLDNKRYSWNTVNNLIKKVPTQTKFNKNIKINWSLKEAVLEYYNSFVVWVFYIAGGDVNKENLHLLEVKEGLVFFNNEYWLPAPQSSHQSPNIKTEVKDGWYYVHLIKRNNNWFGNKSDYYSNVFYVRNAVNVNPTVKDIKKLKPNSTEIYCKPWNYYGFKVEYSHSGRSGLSIDNISFNGFEKLFKERYCSDRWGYNTEFIVVPKEIYSKLMYSEGFGNTLEDGLNNILGNASYDIDDDDSYGEYSLNHIKISEKDSKKFFDLIDKRLKNLN